MSYGRLAPDATMDMHRTFRNHPWLFRDVATRKRMNWQRQQVLPS